MEPKYSDIDAIIINYLSGCATSEEINELKKWLSLNEENKRHFDEMADVWDATYAQNRQKFNAGKAFEKVREQIWDTNDQKDHDNIQSINSLKSLAFYRIAMTVAAAFILLLGIGVVILTKKNTSLKNLSENSITEIVAPMGAKSSVVLPDGTKVWLNAGSKIRYNSAFNLSNRKISLEGEAYFDVTKNKKLPFLVAVKDITVKVLGTAFNVKAYPGEGSVETTLVRGSLVVEQTSENKVSQTLLAPNQRATFVQQTGKLYLSDTETRIMENDNIEKVEDVKGKMLVAKEIDTEIFTAWKDNKLVFRNESFESLAIKLERWYGVKINITGDKVKDYHFNGTIENETINDVLEIIRYTLPIQYTIQHNIITIK